MSTSAIKHFAMRALQCVPWMALVGLIIGARLWLISGYGSALPLHDSWDAEAAFLFKPWLENSLHWSDLFSPHNEHRMVLSRLLALAVLQANGQWDALLEITVNAVLCGLFGLGIAAGLVSILGPAYRLAVLVSVTLWLALPYGHETTLWAFHAFHFLLFFSFVAIWGLGFFPPFSRNWWLGALAAVLACFSTASGFFAMAVVLSLEGFRVFARQQRCWLPAVPTCLFAIAIVVLGLSLRVTVVTHDLLKAASFSAWLSVFARSLAWPYVTIPILMVVVYLPLTICTFLMVRGRSPLPQRHGELFFSVGVWVIAQAAAIAYTRGEHGNIAIASRYMEALALGALVNALCVVALLRSLPASGKGGPVLHFLGTVWIVALFGGAAELGLQKLSSGPGNEALLPMQENVRAYVATHDRKYLTGDLPYPNADRLATLLDDPTIRKILPAIVRPPLPLEIRQETGQAFILNGYPAEIGNPPFEKTWGSYSQSGAQARGSLESDRLNFRLPYLQFEVSGNPRAGTGLSLHSMKTGKDARLTAGRRINDNWRSCVVRVPGDDVQIIARDDSTEDWIAFHEPREMGRLSYYAVLLVANRQNLFRVSVSVLAIAITGALLAGFHKEPT